MAGSLSVAKQRWRILGDALRSKQASSASISGRRFETFGLFRIAKVNDKVDSGGEWYEYTIDEFKKLRVLIRHIPNSVNAEVLVGFNNTGNICIWPSEEVLAYYSLKHSHIFSGKTVCELGGGMSCLAGITVAVSSMAKRVLLTDGNDASIQNVNKIVQKNHHGTTSVQAGVLRWGEFLGLKEFEGEFDYILSADCLFFKELNECLADTIHFLLKSGGTAIIMAPSRGNSLDYFCHLAELKFTLAKLEHYDDRVQSLYEENKTRNSSFCEDLHYPILLKLHKR